MTAYSHPPESNTQPGVRVDAGRSYRSPFEYDHPYPSMAEFAKRLALRFDCNRTS